MVPPLTHKNKNIKIKITQTRLHSDSSPKLQETRSLSQELPPKHSPQNQRKKSHRTHLCQLSWPNWISSKSCTGKANRKLLFFTFTWTSPVFFYESFYPLDLEIKALLGFFSMLFSWTWLLEAVTGNETLYLFCCCGVDVIKARRVWRWKVPRSSSLATESISVSSLYASQIDMLLMTWNNKKHKNKQVRTLVEYFTFTQDILVDYLHKSAN